MFDYFHRNPFTYAEWSFIFSLSSKPWLRAKNSCERFQNINKKHEFNPVRHSLKMENASCFFCLKPSTDLCQHCKNAYFCSKDHLNIHRPGKKKIYILSTITFITDFSSESFCFPFVVKENEFVGRFVVASRDIKPTGKWANTKKFLLFLRS